MGDLTEVRFTETNGIRCWRCCPLPLKPSGQCECPCHRKTSTNRACRQLIWNHNPRQSENVPCSRYAMMGSDFCWQHSRRYKRKAP